jgi:hypothetical protein
MAGGVLSLSPSPPVIQTFRCGLMLFKPLKDQTGIQTPSWASRLWFVCVMFGCSAYIWLQVSQNLAIWSLCTLMLSTLLLNLGWVISAKLSHNQEPSVLFQSLGNEDE